MSRKWSSAALLAIVSLTLRCETEPFPTMNGQWTGSNQHYHLIYNDLVLTQKLFDTSFSGTGTWWDLQYTGRLHVNGVLARGAVTMSLEYDSGATKRVASYRGVLTDTLHTNGLEVFSSDSADSLFLEKCGANPCGTGIFTALAGFDQGRSVRLARHLTLRRCLTSGWSRRRRFLMVELCL